MIGHDLVPAPKKLVANLPYNIATPLVVESLEHACSIELWCVMVQREVADRFFATPRTKAYGAVSVLVQLAARRTGFHPVPPTVFRPPPGFESALVAFERAPERADRRRATGRRGRVRPPAQDRGECDRAHGRWPHASEVEEALESIGHAVNARAEELEPAEFVALAEALR